MSIQITIIGNDAAEALTELRVLAAALVAIRVAGDAAPVKVAEMLAAQAAASTDDAPQVTGQPEVQTGEPEKKTVKRRTKAEMEADKAAKEQAAAAGNADTQAQDAADQKDEVDANREPGKALTRDDVKSAMARYVQNYGMPATQEDGPKIFREALGAPPEGEAFWKLSLVPEDDQEKLAKVVDIWTKANDLNPLKRAKVS